LHPLGTLGKAALLLFAFDLYDNDSSGFIDKDELGTMLRDIYGQNYSKNALAQKVSKHIQATNEQGDEVNITVFQQFVKTHPAMLYPAFSMQDQMQQRILGKSFWSVAASKRLELTNDRGEQQRVYNILDAQVNDKAFHYLVNSFHMQARDPNKSVYEKEKIGTAIDAAGSVAKRRAEKGVVTKVAMEKLVAVKAFEDAQKKKKTKLAKKLKGNSAKKATVLQNVKEKKKTMKASQRSGSGSGRNSRDGNGRQRVHAHR